MTTRGCAVAAPRTLVPRRVHSTRGGRPAALVVALMVAMPAIGVLGCHAVHDSPRRDSFPQSAMLRAGTGPVQEIDTTAGQLSDGVCAIGSTLVMLGSAGFLFAPASHRVRQRLRLDDAGADQ